MSVWHYQFAWSGLWEQPLACVFWLSMCCAASDLTAPYLPYQCRSRRWCCCRQKAGPSAAASAVPVDWTAHFWFQFPQRCPQVQALSQYFCFFLLQERGRNDHPWLLTWISERHENEEETLLSTTQSRPCFLHRAGSALFCRSKTAA